MVSVQNLIQEKQLEVSMKHRPPGHLGDVLI